MGTEFQLNTQKDKLVFDLAINALPDGGYILCWTSLNENATGLEIMAQLLDENGLKKGNEFQVNTSENGLQYTPSGTGLSDGKFAFCWTSENREGNGRSIYGQLFTGGGLKLGNEFQVNASNESDQINPTIYNLDGNSFIISWSSKNPAGNYEIFAQFFNIDGSKKGSEFHVNTHTQGNQTLSSLTSLQDSSFVVCWESSEQDGDGAGIFAKHLKVVNHQLLTFTLKEPKIDETLFKPETEFTWERATKKLLNFPWEIEYVILLSRYENLDDPLIINAIYDTTCTIDSLSSGTTYFWKVLAKNIAGDSLWCNETYAFFVSYDATVSDISKLKINPVSFELYPNYPNPFNPETNIKYTLPFDQAQYDVTVKIYNALGQLVEIWVEASQIPGLYRIKWNAANMPGGVYFCVVQAGSYRAIQKMLLVR